MSKFDVSTEKGLMAFNGNMRTKSYVEGFSFSSADSECFSKFTGCPDKAKTPDAYRWFIHIAALSGVRGLSFASAGAAAPAAAAGKKDKKEKKEKKAEVKAIADDDDDDFDVFGDDNEEEEEAPKEDRAAMVARLKKEAEIRTAKKEANQRTLVGIDVKPWSTEQDLKELWKKITTTINQEGIKWGETCHLVEVAFGIKKLIMSFTMGATNSSDDIIEAIEALEDEVQSVEMTSMNVL